MKATAAVRDASDVDMTEVFEKESGAALSAPHASKVAEEAYEVSMDAMWEMGSVEDVGFKAVVDNHVDNAGRLCWKR